MRRGIVCVALLSAMTAPTVSSATPTATATVWVAERVSRSAPRIEIDAKYTWGDEGSTVTVADANVVRGRLRPIGGWTFDAVALEGPVVHDRGTAYGCLPRSTCNVLQTRAYSAFWYLVPEDMPQPDRVYLSIYARTATVKLTNSPGWRLVRTRLRTRYALSDSGGATSVRVAGEQPEHFTEATLPGGRRGSIAVGSAPCRLLHNHGYFREGYGTATLTGGTAPADFDCQRDIDDPVAVAEGPTTWRFAGDVVGNSMGPTRIAVIDL